MYKEYTSFSNRLHDTTNILSKYPDRIPIICERDKMANKDCPQIDKKNILFQEN